VTKKSSSCVNFEILIRLKKFILILLIISFRKKFKNVMMFTFLELFGQEHKFAICFSFKPYTLACNKAMDKLEILLILIIKHLNKKC
jgi:hypothetical protein